MGTGSGLERRPRQAAIRGGGWACSMWCLWQAVGVAVGIATTRGDGRDSDRDRRYLKAALRAGDDNWARRLGVADGDEYHRG
ncbi:hypothetical protein GUJ93_ZPchr0007g3289 [Zizania palustris]|uniref:Uncharacterized protein n=1 Tax=Zizania palustris TaxID=103762 RepID=A0A8J5TBR7_ZIZPA|nr:hypothetical protein GUJ93_ZPchr0007g3289 [Zizania palustris]